MAVIKLNRTKTGVVPTALEDGELYIDQLNGRLYWADATGAIKSKSLLSEEFASGTKMLFRQSSAPVGWTKDTSINDAALRVVSGSVSSGGSAGFAAAFAAGVTAGNTALTVNQIPAHTHTATVTDPGHTHTLGVTVTGGLYPTGSYMLGSGASPYGPTASSQTGITVANANTGGGQAHNHSLPMADLKYVDVIVATKD